MKRRIYKQILSGMLGFLLIISLAGCGQSSVSSKPEETMEAFYDLIIKQDTSSMTDLGIDSTESKETLKTYQSSMISTLQKSFKNAGVEITKSQAEDIFQAISDKLSSLEYKVSVSKNDDKEATVKVSSQYINYLDIFKQAKRTTLDELKPMHIENLSDAKKQLVSNVVSAFKSAAVSSDMHSQTFKLKLQKIKSGDNTIHIFFPENYKEVGSKLTQIVTNQ